VDSVVGGKPIVVAAARKEAWSALVTINLCMISSTFPVTETRVPI
jgi:hypothetical protein